MYLKRLEIIGFKSFADKVRLEFGPGLTVIVGPNGSGKSNIAEAIRWVLGEQSARELRGARMEDVIFAGSESRRPMGYAEVSLVLDNGDGRLPLAYSEVMITRRVDRAGESEYLINQVPCRLKDITDLLLDTGLGRENYSVIGQGRVDEILLARPEDRRVLFEEAAGISRYKARRREATRKLEDTDQNLVRLADLIAELEGRLQELAAEAERAERYQGLAAELAGLQIGLLARDLARVGAQRDHWREQVAALRAQAQEVERRLQEAEEALAARRQLAAALDQEAAVVQGQQVEAAAHLERAQSALALCRQQQEQAAAERDRLAQEEAALVQRQEAVARDQEALKAQEAAAAAAAAQVEQELAAREADLAAAQAELAAAAQRLEDLRREAAALARAAAEARQQAAAEERAGAQARAERDRLAAAVAAAQADLSQAQAQHQRAAARAGELAKRREAAAGDLAAARARQQEAAAAEAGALQRLAALREQLEAARSRLGLLEELKAAGEGLGRGVRYVLQARLRGLEWAQGVCGTVADLLAVDPAHERAIETALGPALQHIVTRTDADAKACIAQLKASGAGRATFLPLSVIRPAAFRPDELAELQSVPGFVGVALDLCQVAAEFRPAVAYLLGRVAVAQDMDAALAIGRRTGFRHRVVTLEGEVLAPGGALTGGAPEARSAGVLGRERERRDLAAAVGRLQQELAAAEVALAGARAARVEAAAAVEAAEAALRRVEAEAAAAAAEVQAAARQAEEASQRLATLAAEQERWQRQAEGGADAVRELLARAESLAAQEADAVRAEAAQAAAVDRLRLAVASAGEAVTGLRIRLAELSQERRSLAAQAERLAAEASRLAAEAADRACRRSELSARLEALKAEEEAAAAQVAAARAAKEALDARLAGLQERRLAVQAELVAAERDIRHLRRAQADLQAQAGEAGVTLARLEAEWSALAQRLAADHGLDPAAAVGRALPEAAVGQAQARVRELQEALRALGPVNPGAVAAYQQARERHAFLLRQRADLEEARSSLRRAIDELDRRIRDQFQAAFQAVRREFQQVYQDLFEGGRADLQLTPEADLLEAGVEILAAPPGKKLTPLPLLSGGERAMTAIALLFALLRVRPTPFVVLDEVEAALDEANVERVARYLRRHAGATQFICISHQRGTMEAADALYGVTMEGTGVSRVVSVRLTDLPARG